MAKSKLGLLAGGPSCIAHRSKLPTTIRTGATSDTSKTISTKLTVRDAQVEDYVGIRKIINSKNNRASFGYLPRVVVEDAVKNQNADGEKSQHRICVVVDANGRIVAFLRAYNRQDGATTLHEIGVAEDMQSSGIGSFLLTELITASRKRGMEKVALKTPVGMRSNGYYPRFGFKQVGTYKGRKRVLNCYELTL